MKILLTVLNLLLTSSTYAQDIVLEWDTTTDEEKARFESSILLGENRAIIIQNTMHKPMGLKPFLYTYDTQKNQVDCQLIPNWKNLETYKEFFTSPHYYVGDKKNIYRVTCEFGKKKKGVQPYSFSIDELDEKTLRPVATPLINMYEGTTKSHSALSVLLNEKYLAVVFGCSNGAMSGFGGSDRAIEVKVYTREDMGLVYNQEYTLGKDATSTQIGDIALKQNGEVHLVVIRNQVELKSMADAKILNASPNAVNYIAFSERGVDADIFSEGTTHLNASIAEMPNGSSIGVAFAKTSPLKNGAIELHAFEWSNGAKNTNSIQLSLSDLLNVEKSSYSKSFLDKIEDSDQLYVNFSSSEQTFDKDGNLIQLFDFKITTEIGIGITNTLFACLIAKIAPDGTILWVNSMPAIGGLGAYGVDYAALVDVNQNIHVLSNGILSEYPNGNYEPNSKVEVNAGFVPIEIVINGADGNIVSSVSRENGFTSGEGFSPHTFLKLSNNIYLVGKNEKGKLVNTSSSEDMGITYGILRSKQ